MLRLPAPRRAHGGLANPETPNLRDAHSDLGDEVVPLRQGPR